jgi:hypothetical protein
MMPQSANRRPAPCTAERPGFVSFETLAGPNHLALQQFVPLTGQRKLMLCAQLEWSRLSALVSSAVHA